MGPEKENEKEDLHLKTGLEHSTLIGIQEEESDKKYVGQITLSYNYLIVLCKKKILLDGSIVEAGSLFRGWYKVTLKVSSFVSDFNLLHWNHWCFCLEITLAVAFSTHFSTFAEYYYY